jgi:hypothetical protein
MSHGFTQALAKHLIGKMVEVYSGDEFETLLYAEYNTNKFAVIYGRLLEIDDECLILEVTFGNKSNKMYINSWQIKTICEPKDGMTTANMIVCVSEINNMVKNV